MQEQRNPLLLRLENIVSYLNQYHQDYGDCYQYRDRTDYFNRLLYVIAHSPSADGVEFNAQEILEVIRFGQERFKKGTFLGLTSPTSQERYKGLLTVLVDDGVLNRENLATLSQAIRGTALEKYILERTVIKKKYHPQSLYHIYPEYELTSVFKGIFNLKCYKYFKTDEVSTGREPVVIRNSSEPYYVGDEPYTNVPGYDDDMPQPGPTPPTPPRAKKIKQARKAKHLTHSSTQNRFFQQPQAVSATQDCGRYLFLMLSISALCFAIMQVTMGNEEISMPLPK